MEKVRRKLQKCDGNLNIKVDEKAVHSDNDCEIRDDLQIYKNGRAIARIAPIKEKGSKKEPSFSSILTKVSHLCYETALGIHPYLIFQPDKPDVMSNLFERKIFKKSHIISAIFDIQGHPLYNSDNFELLPPDLQEFLKFPDSYFDDLMEELKNQEDFLDEKTFNKLIKSNPGFGNILTVAEKLDSIFYQLNEKLITWGNIQRTKYGHIDLGGEKLSSNYEYDKYKAILIVGGLLKDHLGVSTIDNSILEVDTEIGPINGFIVPKNEFPSRFDTFKHRYIKILFPPEIFPEKIIVVADEEFELDDEIYLDPFRYETAIPVLTGLFDMTDNDEEVNSVVVLNWIKDLGSKLELPFYTTFKNEKGEEWGIIAMLYVIKNNGTGVPVVKNISEDHRLLIVEPEINIHEEEESVRGTPPQIESLSEIEPSPMQEQSEIGNKFDEGEKVLFENEPFTVVQFYTGFTQGVENPIFYDIRREGGDELRVKIPEDQLSPFREQEPELPDLSEIEEPFVPKLGDIVRWDHKGKWLVVRIATIQLDDDEKPNIFEVLEANGKSYYANKKDNFEKATEKEKEKFERKKVVRNLNKRT